MNGIRYVFRLGALGMVAALLAIALTVPASAAGATCDDANMLELVEILSVAPVESSFNWETDDLLSYGDGDAGTYSVGQLEVQFEDINTLFNITHYDVIAVPTDEPGASNELGIDEVVKTVDRPSEVGSKVTTTLDLEPGTNYVIDVVAMYYSIQVSPNQGKQDSLAATTFLSPPFLGGGISGDFRTSASPSDQGVHYLVYKDDGQLHTLRWLGPDTYGPFDHTWKNSPDEDGDNAGADILCTNKEGDLEDDCAHDDGVGLTHFRVEVTDEDGTAEYVQRVPIVEGTDVYSSEFNLNDGTYTFAVDAGYVEDDKFYALSDKAQVLVDIPDDYLRFNQAVSELQALVDDIVNTVKDEDDDFDVFYDSDWNYKSLAQAGIGVAAAPADPNSPTDDETAAINEDRTKALTVYLNNLYH